MASVNDPDYPFLLQVPGDCTQHPVLKSSQQFDPDALAGSTFFRKGSSLHSQCPWDWAYWNPAWELLNSTEASKATKQDRIALQ